MIIEFARGAPMLWKHEIELQHNIPVGGVLEACSRDQARVSDTGV